MVTYNFVIKTEQITIYLGSNTVLTEIESLFEVDGCFLNIPFLKKASRYIHKPMNFIKEETRQGAMPARWMIKYFLFYRNSA